MSSKVFGAIKKIKDGAKSDNANIRKSPMQKMLSIGGASAKQYLIEKELPEDIAKAFVEGDIHIHDADFYDSCLTCIQIPLGKMLARGFNTGNGFIRPPKRISTAINLTAILIQSEQNDQYGGVSIPNLEDLAPYVDLTRKRLKKAYTRFAKGILAQNGIKEINSVTDKLIDVYVEEALDNEILQAMEALVHNLNTMHSRAGSQVPFSSVNLGLGTTADERKIIQFFLQAFNNGLGKGEIPLFPQVVFKWKAGINKHKGDLNYDLFQLALQVASKRLNPTFLNCDSSFNAPYDPWVLSSMGCRTRVVADRHGEATSIGRGNLSFTTINLPRLAMETMFEPDDGTSSVDVFFHKLNKKLELVKRQLLHRYHAQAQLRVDDLPFMMGQGLYVGSEKLKRNDFIKEAIKHGTLSIGFIGLAEALMMLIGEHHAESEDAFELGLKIVKHMRDMCDVYSEQHDLNFTLLATPAEGLAGRFTKIDKEKHGVIEGVTDRDYYTNSCHVPVWYSIDPQSKAHVEGAFHKYCNAGHIFYVEFDGMPINNTQALEEILLIAEQNDVGYMGFNYPVDYCKECGLTGVFNGKCTNCGSEDIIMTRRVTGYLGVLDNFPDGKEKEVNDRKSHVKVNKNGQN